MDHAPRRRGARLAWVLTALAAAAAPASPEVGFRTMFQPRAATAVHAALRGASTRLESPGCRRLFSEYRDASGQTLNGTLRTRALTARDQLSRILFADGAGQAACRRPDVLAITMPGSRVVYVCATRFWVLQQRNPARAEAVLIHELLHSIGLAHDSPSSRSVTDRVVALCGG